MSGLEEYYEQILNIEFKVIPNKIITFFDIAGFPHYETVMSNFYSYYFDPNEQHGLNDLFISAISDLIIHKTQSISVISNSKICYTKREVVTKNGKYIDIVVMEPSEFDNIIENAIIIENKVNATVYNDLTEYYKSINVNNRKIGIVLSLRPEVNLPDNFINITHKELVSQVEQSSGFYFLSADTRQILMLKEFIQNIKSMSQTIDLKDQYDFFFKHQNKIKEISALYSTIKTDVFKQVDEVCEKLGLGLKLQGRYNSQLRYFFSGIAPVYFTIWLNDLFNGDGEIYIFVELNEEGIGHIDEINKIEFSVDEKKLIDETSKVRKTYMHYATKVLIPTPDDIKDFTNYIYNQISQTSLIDIFIKIEKQIVNNK